MEKWSLSCLTSLFAKLETFSPRLPLTYYVLQANQKVETITPYFTLNIEYNLLVSWYILGFLHLSVSEINIS